MLFKATCGFCIAAHQIVDSSFSLVITGEVEVNERWRLRMQADRVCYFSLL